MRYTADRPLVFDGHNDVLSALAALPEAEQVARFVAGLPGDLDLARAAQAGFAGGFFAIWPPVEEDFDDHAEAMSAHAYQVPLPVPVARERAMDVVVQQASILFRLEAAGALEVCRSVGQIRSCMARGKMAAIFHMEGAEAIGADLRALDLLWQAGLRSLGLVWSRETIFGHGVPFNYPATPDIGPGLTDAGKALVRRCNELGILIDLSHLNEAGMRDVAALSDAPLVASHSCVHAICPHARNLTDAQLHMIAESNGLVGLNFASAFVREDGRMVPEFPFSLLLRHLDHLLEIVGEGGVALGSDYDGATTSADLQGIEKLPNLRAAMREHGYSEALIAGICHENWLRVLDATWHRAG